MKKHILKNQHDKHIDGKDNREEILTMLDRGLDEITIDGKRITVQSDFRKEDERVTVLCIEGI